MLQGWNLQEWTNQHDVARVDIAGVDNAAPLWHGWTMQEWSEVTTAFSQAFDPSLREHPHGNRGNAEFAGVDNSAPYCRVGICRSGQISTMWQGWTLQEWTVRHHVAGVDNAGVDNAGGVKCL